MVASSLHLSFLVVKYRNMGKFSTSPYYVVQPTFFGTVENAACARLDGQTDASGFIQCPLNKWKMLY